MVDKLLQPPDKPAAKKRKNANAKSPKQEAPSAAAGAPGEVKQSCAECRRMKIKCDRVFPCKTCVKRGLEGICPEGSLVTGRGTRYVLASTEELHGKIERMAERIRSLEDALGHLHREHSACPTRPPSYPDIHPLLQGEALQVKGQLDLYGIEPSRSQSADAETTHSESREPTTELCGRTASRDNENAYSASGLRPPSPSDSDIDPSLLDTKRKYMMDVDETEIDGRPLDDRQRFLRTLVKFSKAETLRLYGVAVHNFGWVLNLPTQPGYILGFIEKFYDQSVYMEPQQFALVFATLAIGARLDSNTHYNSDAHSHTTMSESTNQRTLELYRSAKMALTGAPVQSKPDYCTLLAIYTLAWYLALLTDFKDAGRQAWIMIRLAVKLATTLGLNREATYATIPSNERFEHRLLFWSIVHLESRLELLGGRNAGLTRSQIDCEYPLASSYGAPQVFSSRFEAIYNDYKLRFTDDVTIPVVEAIANARKTRLRSDEYNGLLDLDARIRDYPIPTILSNWFYHAGAAPFRRRPKYPTTHTHASGIDGGEVAGLNETPDCPPHVSTLIRSLVFQQTAISLLQLHLPYAHCHCRDHRTITQRRFMPSAIAAFSASVSLIESTRKLYDAEPALAARVSTFWYNAFCSATWLFVLVVMKPFCPVAVLAIQELEKVRNLFCAASRDCYMAARSFPILREFYSKAKIVFDRWSDATSPLYESLPVKVPDQSLFGSAGEIMLCQNRLDLIVQQMQRVPGSPSEDEAAATVGLLDLNRAPHTFDERTSVTVNGRKVSTLQKLENVAEKVMSVPGMDVDEPLSPEMNDETFYDMWSHAHEEICDFVRRAPDVLRDAQVDPRRATAARLIWGIIPERTANLDEVEDAQKSEAARLEKLDIQNLDVYPRSNQVSQDLDWDAITDALMNVSPATSSSATASLSRSTSTTSPSISPSLSTMPSRPFGPGKSGKDILLTPPPSVNRGTPIGGNTTAFPLLEACASIDALYEPVDVSNVDIDALDIALESYAMDGSNGIVVGTMEWPQQSGKPDKRDEERLQALASQLKQIKSVDRCSYGNPVPRNETVGGVFEQFGRSPYLSY